MTNIGKNKIFMRLVIFAIAAITCLAALELVPTASATDIYVPGDYATIQQAVNAANPGDTIIVAADTYGEMILINKPLTLRGANAGIHPTVGVHPDETVGTRGPESILSHDGLYAIRPSADNITIDGFKFTGTGGQIIDTSNNANNFSLLNCIFDNPGDFGNKGNVQFGAGSHNDLLLAYNIFINGGDHTFYAGGGPFDRMHIIGNKFNSKGTAIFWAATPLVDGIVEYNEFDGAYNSVPGTGGARMNIGKGGNIIIRNNWFHDLYASGSQVGIIDGQVTDNIFENIYPHLTANFGSCFELWGGQWGTTISSNVTIERNDFYYNNVTGATAPTHGLRLRAPESGLGINGSTIHVHNNNFYDGSINTDAHALWHQASDTVDGLCNWWSNTTGPYDLNGSVDYDPWLDAAYPYGYCGCISPPTNFKAETHSKTVIKLTWMNDGANYSYIEYNLTEGSWARGDGFEILNSSTKTTYNHTNLIPGTTYYYQAWSYNQSHNYYSATYVSNQNTTKKASPPPRPQEPDDNIPPIANIGGPYQGYVGFNITFSGAESYAPNGTIIGYRWDFTGDGIWDTDWLINPATSHIYDKVGIYTLHLQVKDNASATETDTTTVTVQPPKLYNASNEIITILNELFGLNLTLPFQAKDTTGDGNIDTFIDPNNMIYLIRSAIVYGNIIFLLAIQQGDMPDFFWDPKTDEIALVTSSEVTLSEPIVDEKAQEITFTISVEKSDWIYIKMIDQYPLLQYPNFTLIAKTGDGRVIPSDWIWRENGFIYMLDDPDVTYLFIYGYEELPADLIPPTPDEPEKIGIPIWIYIIGLIILIILILAAVLKTGIFKKKEKKKTK